MSRARAARRPEIGEMIASAKVRFARVPARKVRYVADLLRGLTVAEANRVLMALHKPSAAPVVDRLLKSAVANARDKEYNGDPDLLLVGQISVDAGPMLKRFMAAPMGRAVPVRKRMSHMTIKLHEQA